MTVEDTPHCPLPNIGPCVGERCNFLDEEEGCQGVGVVFAADPSLEERTFADGEDYE
jgi:hypothetical protein